MRHVITMLVENQPGVLARIVGLISGRGFNIDTLNVAPTADETVSRMTIQVPGDDRIIEQITKQLNKLIDIIKVSDVTRQPFVERELVLARIRCSPRRLGEIKDLVALCGARVAAMEPKSVCLELTGTQAKVDEFLALLRPYTIMELTRTGVVALNADEGRAGKQEGTGEA